MERRVVATGNGRGRFGQTVEVRGHALAADEPVASGGLDGGPDPFELVLAGLGACTSMTVRMYADRKGWRLDEVSVETVLVRAVGDAVDRIDRVLRLDGDLDDERRRRLVEIADRCPVGRMIAGGADIRTVAADPAAA